MERYFYKITPSTQSSIHKSNDEDHQGVKRSIDHASVPNLHGHPECSNAKKKCVDFQLEDLISDPGLRPHISSYDVKDQDVVRRAYLQKGPCQPKGHTFPPIQIQDRLRPFQSSWFNDYGSWLEYSVSQNAAYCLYCFIFPRVGGDGTFVTKGFNKWKSKAGFEKHVGKHNSAHNIARKKCEDLMIPRQNIQVALSRQTDEARREYRIRLSASLDCIRFLLRQGLAFRGHDEIDESSNQGNFLELLQFLASHNESIERVVLRNAPENLKLTFPKIQKEIVSAISVEAIEEIIKELGDDLFSILVDESQDVSTKEQMAIVLRYLNDKGQIIECFLGLVHVMNTTALSLKSSIDDFLSRYGLSTMRLRGQGYDGASNMKGAFGGLKTLILNENPSAFYVHCFAHQLQLTLVATAEGHSLVASLFQSIINILNIVGGSCKRRDNLRAKEVERVARELDCGELTSGKGLNQELGIKRPGDTRWNSHYLTLINFVRMFSSIIDVLEILKEDGDEGKQRGLSSIFLGHCQTYEFVFLLHLMKNVLAKTNELSQALQRNDQDIINAMTLVKLAKSQLTKFRNDDEEWISFINEVNSFCAKHEIEIADMDGKFVALGRSRRNQEEKTNSHHYRVEIFNTVIDYLLNELNDRFSETSTELLLCIACLDPSGCFRSFDKEKLIQLARFYPCDFSPTQCLLLEKQLDTYILDMRTTLGFAHLNGISGLAQKLIELKKDRVYPLVYLLIKLALLLPVATASVERVFSAMKIIKSRLRNKMGDEWMNDCLVTYIERDVVDSIDNEAIMKRFQNTSNRRGLL